MLGVVHLVVGTSAIYCLEIFISEAAHYISCLYMYEWDRSLIRLSKVNKKLAN